MCRLQMKLLRQKRDHIIKLIYIWDGKCFFFVFVHWQTMMCRHPKAWCSHYRRCVNFTLKNFIKCDSLINTANTLITISRKSDIQTIHIHFKMQQKKGWCPIQFAFYVKNAFHLNYFYIVERFIVGFIFVWCEGGCQMYFCL